MSATCSACHEPIVFGQTDSGRKMPLNREPNADGNVLEIGRTGRMLAIRVLTKDELANPPAGRRFISHFATCPEKGQFRRRNARVLPTTGAFTSKDQAANFIAENSGQLVDGGDIMYDPDTVDSVMRDRLYRSALDQLQTDSVVTAKTRGRLRAAYEMLGGRA
jgi:hypothetical protein